MTVKAYVAALNTTATPQSQAIPGREAEQHKNAAGGYVFSTTDWQALDRFLILGTEGGTYYASEKDHTLEAIGPLQRITASGVDGPHLVQRIVEVSTSGRAPKNTPAVLALAYVSKKHPVDFVRRAANDAMPLVCRTGTDLFAFAEFVETFGGWSRGSRRAVAEWYTRDDTDRVAYQLVKYRQRNGWTHRDLLRLAHPAPSPLLRYAAGKLGTDAHVAGETWAPPRIIAGYAQAQRAATPSESAKLIREYGLPRECVSTDHLSDPLVWDALLDNMPMTALIRNLGNMSKVGLLAPMSDALRRVMAQLTDTDRLRKARVHPMAILLALKTYAQGHSQRGNGEWSVVQQVVDALDEAFYLAIGVMEPTGKRYLIAVDTSGSMQGSWSGTTTGGMYPCEAAAAMALITAKSEPNHYIMGFDTAAVELPISPRMRLDEATRIVRQRSGGGTDVSIPMLWALQQRMDVDAILLYTDNETWAGRRAHAAQALAQYRKAVNSSTRCVYAAMTATQSTCADPADPLTMECVGLDATTPSLIRSFAAGEW